jgi:hypothetical protein
MDFPDAASQILFMAGPNARQMLPQGLTATLGKNRHPVFAPLSITHGDLPTVEVEILHAEPQALHEAKARPVQQAGHEGVLACQPAKNSLDLLAGEHGRKMPGPPGARKVTDRSERLLHHVPEEKYQRVEGLPLRGRRHLARQGEVFEEIPHASRVGLAAALGAERKEALSPYGISPLGAEGVVSRPHY